MTQPIDPTTWPKVEGSTSAAGYYFAVAKKAPNHVSLWCVNDSPFPIDDSVFLYGPIIFAKPVPAPEVTLYLIRTKDGDKWCQADAVDGRKDKILYDVGTCNSRGSIEQANIIRTATLKDQA